MESSPIAVLQFGTGKFLRAFVDLFIHELNISGHPIGTVAVVQSTGNLRAESLCAQRFRYHVRVRGMENSQRVDRLTEVTSIRKAWAAETHWHEILQAATSPQLQAIVSNVTEAGYEEATATDFLRLKQGGTPETFPAKLAAVLHARFHATHAPVSILPCELIDCNGKELRDLVLRVVKSLRAASNEFVEWVGDACRWHNTLVDRIVAAADPTDPLLNDDPLLAIAEPFAFWAIEPAINGQTSPFVECLAQHSSIEIVADTLPYSLRKIRILNAAHTALVARAMPLGFRTVREAVEDGEMGLWLQRMLMDEVVPTIEDRVDDAREFAETTLERFLNPDINHQLGDIAMHHDAKVAARLAPTCEEHVRRFAKAPILLSELL